MADAYLKRPTDTIRATFDFRAFVSQVGVPVVFMLKAEEGIDYTDQTSTEGLIELDISLGQAGRVYRFGVEAKTEDETSSSVLMSRVRVIDPSEWPTLPDGTAVGAGVDSSDYADDYADDYVE